MCLDTNRSGSINWFNRSSCMQQIISERTKANRSRSAMDADEREDIEGRNKFVHKEVGSSSGANSKYPVHYHDEQGTLRGMDFIKSTSAIPQRQSVMHGMNGNEKKRKRDMYSSLLNSETSHGSKNLKVDQCNNDGGIHCPGCTFRCHSQHPNIFTAKYDDDKRATTERESVKLILQKFRTLCDELKRDKKADLKRSGKVYMRVDLQAAKILAKQGVYTGKHYIGHVPGIEVGDEFFCRSELRVICLHHPPMAGIDSTFLLGERVATSVVVAASCYYDNNVGDPDVLIYSGQGGNARINGREEDQKWNYGNISLRNSINVKNPVRVTRSTNERRCNKPIYVYQGLFQAVDYWKEMGMNNNIIFKFKLIRLPDQPYPKRTMFF